MKKLLCFCLAACATPAAAQTLSKPILALGPIQCDTHILNAKLVLNLRVGVYSAFSECNELQVQMENRFAENTPEDALTLMRETEDIIVANYIQHQNLDRLSTKDRKRIEVFKKQIKTRYFVFGKLQQDPLDAKKEYTFQLHAVHVDDWTYVFPVEFITFSLVEIQDLATIKSKIWKVIQKRQDKLGFCKIRPSPTRLDLDRDVQYLILAEWLFPNNPDVQKEVKNYIANDITYEHFLQQKHLVYTRLFAETKSKKGANKLGYLCELAERELDTIYLLMPRLQDNKQREKLRAYQKLYERFLRNARP